MRRAFLILALVGAWLTAAPGFAGALKPAPSRALMAGLAAPPIPAPTAPAPSLVPERDRISDDQARLALARVLAGSDAGLAEAGELLAKVLAGEPDNTDARVELAGVLARQDRIAEARAELDRALARRPGDPALLMTAADLEASLGHAVACRDLYQKALALLSDAEAHYAAELRLAAAANLWGDFYLTEAAYRGALARRPGDVDLRLKLAETLVSSQRYDEAQAVYMELLLDRPDLPEALAGLADLKTRDQDYAAALAWSERLLAAQAGHPAGLRLRAQALFKLQRLDDAATAYLDASRRLGRPADLLVGLGRVRLAQGRARTAQALFAQAVERAPQNPEARFWAACPKQAAQDDFVAGLIRPGTSSPLALAAWGEVYAGQGLRPQAIACLRAALARDPDCFPAAMYLAEVLAADHQYDPALAELKRLDERLPNNRKILIARARALSWSRAYDDSLDIYQRVRALNPGDPVPVMEAARVAAWGKQMPRAQDLYADLTRPAVDGLLAAELDGLARQAPPPDRERLRELARQAGGEDTYQGYERVEAATPQAGLGAPAAAQVRLALTRLSAAYRIQKTAALESRAKSLAWDKRFIAGLRAYEELVAFRPGNQEARFDLAQAECALGLCDREGRTYPQLLAIDPLHNLAGQALRRQEVRSAPALRAGYSHWKEIGRGELSQMERSRLDLGVEVPVFCRFNLSLTGHRWLESPRSYGSSAEAFGPTLALGGQPQGRGELDPQGLSARRVGRPRQRPGRAMVQPGRPGQLGRGLHPRGPPEQRLRPGPGHPARLVVVGVQERPQPGLEPGGPRGLAAL